MQKILSTTAFVAAVAFAGGAFAATAETSDSLLSGILSDATALSASLSNVAQNLNSVDGSIDVDTSKDVTNFDEIITALIAKNNGFGSYSQVNANVYGSDLPAALLNILNPLTLELGNLSTTAIGSLQSGNMTATFNAAGLLAKTSSTSTALSTTAGMSAEQYGAIMNPVALQNISVNSGDIDGSITLALDDVNTKVGNIGTTAIGALGSGAMTATITGQMGTASDVGTGLVNALVGNPG